MIDITKATKQFEEQFAASSQAPHYVLRLFVTGMTPRSSAAIAIIRSICEEHLQGRYDLEVVDIYQHPESAREEQIIAVPTLVKKRPTPLRRFIGDLSDRKRVLERLELTGST